MLSTQKQIELTYRIVYLRKVYINTHKNMNVFKLRFFGKKPAVAKSQDDLYLI